MTKNDIFGVGIAMAVVASACSSGSAGSAPQGVVVGGGGGTGTNAATLDCTWLTGNNCWKTTLASANACLPPKSERGTLSADGKTCTYASGKTVVFDEPLVFPLPKGRKWKFTVKDGAAPCLSFDSTVGTGFSATTSAGTTTESVSATTLTMTCPGGETYESANALDLLKCGDGGSTAGGLPGTFTSTSGEGVTLGLFGATEGTLSIFSCSTK